MSENNLHSTGHMPPHAAMRPKIAIIDNNVLATIGLKKSATKRDAYCRYRNLFQPQ